MAKKQMTPFELEVTDCMAAIKNGDQSQYERLCHLTYAPLCMLAKRYLVNKSDYQDAVADVYLNLCLYAKSYTVGRNGYYYLWEIVKHNAYDYNRDYIKNHPVIIEKIDASDPDNQYEKIISDMDFDIALEKVGYTNAMILLWTFRDGLTQEQIGDLLCVTKSAVNQRLKKSLEKLSKHYKKI